jgi:hypothetical protein
MCCFTGEHFHPPIVVFLEEESKNSMPFQEVPRLKDSISITIQIGELAIPAS